MLLLDVQVEIDPAKEELLNEWYYAHVPRLLSVPGYESGRRYLSLTPGPRYLALYEIKDQSYLPSLLGSDRSLRDAKTLSEWARWDRDLVPHMSHCKTNVYRPRQELSVPLISSDAAIVAIRMDNTSGSREHSERIIAAAIDEFIAVEEEALSCRLLEAAHDPAIDWLGTSPDLLLLVECAGPRAARCVARGDGAAKALLESLSTAGTAPQTTAYRMIARHWPLTKGSINAG
jgi:hypothetical protein